MKHNQPLIFALIICASLVFARLPRPGEKPYQNVDAYGYGAPQAGLNPGQSPFPAMSTPYMHSPYGTSNPYGAYSPQSPRAPMQARKQYVNVQDILDVFTGSGSFGKRLWGLAEKAIVAPLKTKANDVLSTVQILGVPLGTSKEKANPSPAVACEVDGSPQNQNPYAFLTGR